MSRQSVLKRWVPALALVLLPLLRTLMVQAAPPVAPVMGFTATPTVSVATPVSTVVGGLSGCDPILHKQVDPSMAVPGDEVTRDAQGFPYVSGGWMHTTEATVNAHRPVSRVEEV